MKEVFEEEFKKQEVNITNIISSNFTLTMTEIKSLKQEVNDLKKSLEFTQNDLEEKVADGEKKISTFEIKMNEMYDYQIDPDYVNDNLLELQDKVKPHLGQQYTNHLIARIKPGFCKCNSLKGTLYHINEDFSKEALALRKKLWKEVKAVQEKCKIAYLSYKTII